MEFIIPSIHILCAGILSLIITIISVFFIGAYRLKKCDDKLNEELCIALSLPKDHVFLPENENRVIKYSSDKYSSDLLKNRISDLLGTIKLLWVLLSLLGVIAIWGGIAWYVFPENLDKAINAWWLLLSPLFVLTPSFLISLFSQLITGRYPSEASIRRYTIKVTYLAKINNEEVEPNWRDFRVFI